MNTSSIDLGARVGLIGDVHGNLPFLRGRPDWPVTA